MKIAILKYYYSIILLAAKNAHGPTFTDKMYYLAKIIVTFGPIAAALDKMGFWFTNNELFFRGMIFAIAANMYFGWRLHKKAGDFKWREFFIRNIEMWGIIICVYPLLEIISALAGSNVIGETFKIVVQMSTILYPGSKALKNAHLLSEKRYPPAFLMNRFFTFEKTGDINELFKTEKTE